MYRSAQNVSESDLQSTFSGRQRNIAGAMIRPIVDQRDRQHGNF